MKHERAVDDEGAVTLSARTHVPDDLSTMDPALRRTIEARVLEGLRQECGLYVPAALVEVDHLIVPRTRWRRGDRRAVGSARIVEWSLRVPRPWLLPSSSPVADAYRRRLVDPLGLYRDEPLPERLLNPNDPEDLP